MKIVCQTLGVLLFVAVLTGCASIVSKSEYPVSISSNPEEAEITIVNRAEETVFKGKTPATVVLKAGAGFFKGENYTVTFKKDGYATHTAQIKRGVDGWYIVGNLIFGGVVGWLIVDPATGAMWTLKNLHVDLAPQTSLNQNQIHIVTINDIPEQLRSKMIRIH
ncbi:PEGA domain-containing protein [Desulfovulcanus sp.]